MIDEKELMIGDWMDFYSYPFLVNGHFYSKMECLDRDARSSCVGIPLTPEILEKNGFKKVDTQRYDLEDPIVGYHINVNPKRKFIHINSCIMGNCNLYLTDINVHTFQHALRLCGLGNLADNFQV